MFEVIGFLDHLDQLKKLNKDETVGRGIQFLIDKYEAELDEMDKALNDEYERHYRPMAEV